MIGSSGFCMTLGQEFRNCLNHQHHCLSLKCSSVLLKASELDAVSALFLTSRCWHETGLWLWNEYPQLHIWLTAEKKLEYVTRIVVTCSNHAKICDHAADSTLSSRPPPTCLLLWGTFHPHDLQLLSHELHHWMVIPIGIISGRPVVAIHIAVLRSHVRRTSFSHQNKSEFVWVEA